MTSVRALIQQTLRGELGPDPADVRITGSWSTVQQSHHAGRVTAYRNTVLSLRAECAVGSCYVESDELDQAVVDSCVGCSVAELLTHAHVAVRIAALDAYLGSVTPHQLRECCDALVVPGGTTVEKSVFRARAVAALLEPSAGMRVALIGVVNSLVQAIRERGADCLPCDFNTRQTEWGDPVTPHWGDAVESADAVLATGMTLSNVTFEPLLRCAQRRGIPLAVYAQTGSAIVPRFLGQGVSAVSAEPFPFFSLHGGPTTIYLYRSRG